MLYNVIVIRTQRKKGLPALIGCRDKVATCKDEIELPLETP